LIMENKLLCSIDSTMAYPVLRECDETDGVALYHLGERILYGIGTSINVPAAYDILYKANYFLEYISDDLNACKNDDDYKEFEINHFYGILLDLSTNRNDSFKQYPQPGSLHFHLRCLSRITKR